MKILVNKNEIGASAAVDLVREEANVINNSLVPSLKKIGVTLTDELLKDCLRGAGKIKKAYDKETASDLERMSNHAVRSQMEVIAAQAWKDFKAQVDYTNRLVIDKNLFQVVDGYCIITPENEEKVRESTAIYISDPKEIEAYNLHVEIIEKMNQLFKGAIPYKWASIFEETHEGQIIRNINTNYSILANHGK